MMIDNIYEKLKDVAKVLQQADNIELYRQLLDISAAALELQNKINVLQNENDKLKRVQDQEKAVIRHADGPYITLNNDELNIEYCATCWGKDKNLIQFANGKCPVCRTRRSSQDIEVMY